MNKIFGHLMAFFFVFNSFTAFSQSVQVPLNTDYYHLIDRFEVKSGELQNSLHSGLKPYDRSDIVELLNKIDTTDYYFNSEQDRFNFNYLQNDNWDYASNKEEIGNSNREAEKTVIFYKKLNDAYFVDKEDYNIHVSPIFNFEYGNSRAYGVNNKLFTNTRGVEIRGMINDKVGFYSFITENQNLTPTYIQEFYKEYNGFPYLGFVKLDTLNFKKDFFEAQGYFTFNATKNIKLQFGHDKNFIGHGFRSMIFSDFSSPSFNLKTQVQLGKLHYTWIISRMYNTQLDNPFENYTEIPPKFLAFHHLNFNVLKNLNIGLFESVMFGKRDSGFDINYLNPIIFNRYVEGLVGSPDNVLIGGDFKLNLFNTASVYGQLILDELVIKKGENKNNWFNKHAGQIGLKYFDIAGVPTLDLQVEANYSRPYTFSHYSTYSNYSNYNLPVGNPLGSNFKEKIIQLRYQPIPKLNVKANVLFAKKGVDSDSLNYGGSVLKLYEDNRAKDNGVETLQGDLTKIRSINVNASYQLYHNLFIDGNLQLRKQSYPDNPKRRTFEETIMNIGVRFNMARRETTI